MIQIKKLQQKEGGNCNLKNNCIGNCNPLGVPCYKHKAMNNMKIISPKYGVTIVAILAPEGSTGYTVIGNKIIFDINHGLNNKRFDLPEGPYESMGIATEVTEEVWRSIVRSFWDYYKNYKNVDNGAVVNHKRLVCNTATESAMSFLEANEVYSVNPYPYPTYHPEDNLELHDWHLDNWQQAEANTGTWVILMKQND